LVGAHAQDGAADGPAVHGGRPTGEGGGHVTGEDFDVPQCVCGLGKARPGRRDGGVPRGTALARRRDTAPNTFHVALFESEILQHLQLKCSEV
jgi:hypothetical protein